MRPTELTIGPYGDSALLVRAVSTGPADREACWRTVQDLADALTGAAGVADLVATYDSLLVEFDCATTDHDEVAALVRATGPAEAGTRPSTVFEVPVRYGGEDGPDLAGVAEQLGISPAEVVERHGAAEWTVRFLGAPAGAPMLDGSAPNGSGLPGPVRRHPSPRARVPAGSVALSGVQGVIYPVAAPGGWQLIGRTPLRFVDPTRWPHVPYRPGDRFRFVPHGDVQIRDVQNRDVQIRDAPPSDRRHDR